MAKVVLLNSGGVDSALVGAWLTTNQGHEVHSLYVDSLQVNRTATMAAAATTASKWCASHYVATLDFGLSTNYWETIGEPLVEMHALLTPEQQADYKATRPFQDFHVLPNANMVCTSLGVAYAKGIVATDVYSGHRVVVDDAYLDEYSRMAEMSRHRLARPQFYAPFHSSISYMDALTILFGREPTPEDIAYAQAELAHTYSCRWETPCGVCDKCVSRAEIGLA